MTEPDPKTESDARIAPEPEPAPDARPRPAPGAEPVRLRHPPADAPEGRRFAVIEVDRPPMNALGVEVRAGLMRAVRALTEDATLDGAVLTGAGRTFPAGSDVRDLGGAGEPTLADLCRSIEDAPKPVVAAIHGQALGAGCELALACHGRVMAHDAQMGLPDIGLGLVPGAGGTQRLPRLVGAEAALRMLLTGRSVAADAARRSGLVEAVAPPDGLQAAALQHLAQLGGPRPTRARREGFADALAYRRAVQAARTARADDPILAVAQAIACIEAAPLLPFEAGLTFEAEAFATCRDGDQAAALRHAFLAERRAFAPPPGSADLAPFRHVAMVGGGPIAAGIAARALEAGLRVTVLEPGADASLRARKRIMSLVHRLAERAKRPAAEAAAQIGRLTMTKDVGATALADAFLLAGPPPGPVPRGALVLTLGPDRADGVGRMTAFPPSHLVAPVELAVPPEAAGRAARFATQLGLRPLLTGTGPLAIGPTLTEALRQVSLDLVMEGADPYALDAALRGWGLPRGPLEVWDVEGIDQAGGDHPVAVALRAEGWTGQRARAGI
ncbi:MAG: enoyl-CoA hydratase-related protein [Shimia sp.]